MSPAASPQRDLRRSLPAFAIIELGVAAFAVVSVPLRAAPSTADVNVDLEPKDEFIRPLAVTQ
jgi:hypothetical protein